MIPEARLEQILKLIAKAVVRLIEKEKAAGIEPPRIELVSDETVLKSDRRLTKIVLQHTKGWLYLGSFPLTM